MITSNLKQKGYTIWKKAKCTNLFFKIKIQYSISFIHNLEKINTHKYHLSTIFIVEAPQKSTNVCM